MIPATMIKIAAPRIAIAISPALYFAFFCGCLVCLGLVDHRGEPLIGTQRFEIAVMLQLARIFPAVVNGLGQPCESLVCVARASVRTRHVVRTPFARGDQFRLPGRARLWSAGRHSQDGRWGAKHRGPHQGDKS